MNFRKNSVLIIGGGVALLLLLAAAFFLVVFRGGYRDSQAALTAALDRLDALNRRNPFPSPDNVRLAGENLETLKARFADLQSGLVKEQITADKIEPARFAPMLEEAIRSIRARAAEAGVTLPAEPGLGFKDYAAGKLPPDDPRILERLVIQIKALEDLINLAIESKVASIDSLQRDDFELRQPAVAEEPPVETRGRRRTGAARGEAAAPRTIVGGVPMPAASEQYVTERFVIGVTGRETAIWDMLNRLLSRRIVYTIADLSLDNVRTDLGKPVDMKAKLSAMNMAARQAAQPAAGLPAQAAAAVPEIRMEDISREERVVGGRDLIKARIVVDMFRFVEKSDGEDRP